MVDSLTVNLGDRSFPIHFGSDLTRVIAERVATLQAHGHKVAVVTDESIAQVQREAVDAIAGSAARHVVPTGETAKSVEPLLDLWNFLAAEKLDRGSAVVAIGGGVVGDLAGFAAASYLRGVPFYQVPTTLLAMVDSSVGGKTGINLAAGKNLVGAFHQPQAVFIATGWLKTLPAREFAAGMAEVIKYGLLGDAALLDRLRSHPLGGDSAELAGIIRRCCAIKAAIVEADEFETAVTQGRALLNLGHTYAHALEKVAGYSVYLHGEAVAIGLAAAARLSRELGLLENSMVDRIDSALAVHHLPTCLREPLPLASLMTAMTSDKKVRSGQLRFVVLAAIGQAVTRERVDHSLVERVWREIGAV